MQRVGHANQEGAPPPPLAPQMHSPCTPSTQFKKLDAAQQGEQVERVSLRVGHSTAKSA